MEGLKMLTPRDIETREFGRSKVGGYKTEDVEAFLDELLADYTALIEERDNLSRRVLTLSEKLENYRDEQEEWKMTLINTQKSYDEVIKSAQSKADEIIKAANEESENILKNVKNEVVNLTNEVESLKEIKNSLADEIDSFKSNLLAMYEKHIITIKDIQNLKKEAVAKKAPEAEAQVPEDTVNQAQEVPADDSTIVMRPLDEKDDSDKSVSARNEERPRLRDILITEDDDSDYEDDDLIIRGSRRRQRNKLSINNENNEKEDKIRDLFEEDNDKKKKIFGGKANKKPSRFFRSDDDDDDLFDDDDFDDE